MPHCLEAPECLQIAFLGPQERAEPLQRPSSDPKGPFDVHGPFWRGRALRQREASEPLQVFILATVGVSEVVAGNIHNFGVKTVFEL